MLEYSVLQMLMNVTGPIHHVAIHTGSAIILSEVITVLANLGILSMQISQHVKVISILIYKLIYKSQC